MEDKMHCAGSYKTPAKVTEKPQQYRDEWGFLNGPTGRGMCGGCGREVGLLQTGKLARHNAPAEQKVDDETLV
jgi:hypothetical protein